MNAQIVQGTLVRVDGGKFIINARIATMDSVGWADEEQSYDADIEVLRAHTRSTGSAEEWVAMWLGELAEWKVVNGIIMGVSGIE